MGVIVEADDERIAIHEAGHAVVSHNFGLSPGEVSIKREIGSGGRVKTPIDEASKILPKELWDTTDAIQQILLGGIAAETIYDGNFTAVRRVGGREDLEKCQWVLSNLGIESTKEEILEGFLEHTRDILKGKWGAVEALANTLIEKRSISGEESARIIKENLKVKEGE